MANRSAEPQSQFDLPGEVLSEWQDVVNLMAEIVGVPACLIMRVVDPEIEVYVASQTRGNPYRPGAKEYVWDSGLYCEQVIKSNNRLLVPDALDDPDWSGNPDVKLNMIAYLGYPLNLPDGRLFGTICVLDNKANAHSEAYVELVGRFRDLVQSQLDLAYMNRELADENKKLSDYIDEIKVLRGIIPICASCKRVRDGNNYWRQVESYIAKHSEAQFSHSLCPECFQKLYPEIAAEAEKGKDDS